MQIENKFVVDIYACQRTIIQNGNSFCSPIVVVGRGSCDNIIIAIAVDVSGAGYGISQVCVGFGDGQGGGVFGAYAVSPAMIDEHMSLVFLAVVESIAAYENIAVPVPFTSPALDTAVPNHPSP
jgi:hypothetical protein